MPSALSLILKACTIHESLNCNSPQGPSKTLSKNVLWKFRRTRFLSLNEKLYNSFKTGGGQEAVTELGSCIVPAIAQMSNSHCEEDKNAILEVRNKWCHIIDEALGSSFKKHILKITSPHWNDAKCEIFPVAIHSDHKVFALYQLYMDTCRSILGTYKINQ